MKTNQSNQPSAGKQVKINEYGIKETSEMFGAVVSVKKAYETSVADNGKVDFPNDVLNFIDPLTKLPTAINGASLIPKELGDLNQTEIEELAEMFGEVVYDERYQRAFYGLVIAGDAIKEIVTGEKEAA